jgi:hypothetical protein
MKLTHAIRLFVILATFGTMAVAAQISPPISSLPSRDLTLQQYISELERSSAILASDDPVGIHECLAALPGEWVVQTEERPYHVRTDMLRAALTIKERKPNEKSTVVEGEKLRLASLREAAQELLAPGAPETLRQSRATLETILNAREFRSLQGPTYFDFLRTRVFDWIGGQLDRLFEHVRGSRALSSALAWGLIFIAGLLLAYWAVRASIQTSTRIDLSDSAPVGRNWRDWLVDARAAAERGDFRSAIHAAYWAAVSRLVEKKILPEDRSRTPRESLRLVGRESPARVPLAKLTSRLELVWYGYAPATASDWTDAAEQLETLDCLPSSTPKTRAS